VLGGIHRASTDLAMVVGTAALVCGASIVCAPADAVLGPIAGAAAAVSAGTGIALAAGGCSTAKSSCTSDLVNASIGGAIGALPGLRTAGKVAKAAEEGGVIYRTGSRTENALTDPSGVSLRDSVSSSLSAEHPQVFRPGDKIWGVDTAKLPPGSVVRDGTPAGHVSVFASPEEINAAVVEDPLLAGLGLKSLDDFGSFRITK
jgi:hypothetical protein